METAPAINRIFHDQRRVEQVLINLINNAIKFTEKGEICIQCELDPDYLTISVRDTGVGIKAEDMGILFETFRQIESGLTRRYEGTGLGLSISRGLIEMMGGRIWAESDGPGKGSVFRFTLPQKKRRRLVSAKILIIEDNEQNMYLLTFLLNRHGHEVFQAGDGRQGIELAERENPDLILLDIQLPQMDGYAVARKIKAIQALAGIPIVAVTSYAMVGDREKTMAAGCSGYIEKPINPDTFMEQISEFLPGMPQGKKVIA